ncbi:MAG TPA: DUF3524 domain-containing protein [Candidatus Polarisedimenticolia bacterium]|jgi:glycosyltransferase involved in cell wall biosynthesis|nr:DUF3524 domain-containing protein [Candidatus Polarisedimenticolia bacterium]
MNILALEPYYGGSHRAFLDDWAARSRHLWTLRTLPATKWKWRMRHAPYTMARQVAGLGDAASWDLLVASDMLNLAEFRGLAPRSVRSLPALLYFHENQITYPVEYDQERDHHFGFSNMNAALAADRVWFNSAFHLESFLAGLQALLRRMPDHRCPGAVERIREKSRIRPPGIDSFPARGARRQPGPLRILWAARWEREKRPGVFFEALERLAARNVDFRIAVLGGGNASPIDPALDRGRGRFADRVLRWGYLERTEYRAALLEADVVVSTAEHDFFGIGVAEAIAAGAYPMLPDRLAYPEILQDAGEEARGRFLYPGGAGDLAGALELLARRLDAGNLWEGDPDGGRRAVMRFAWSRLAPEYDRELSEMIAEGARPDAFP